MTPPRLVLVPDTISNETVECLTQLLEHARTGKIRGIAFAALLKRQKGLQPYIVNSAGDSHVDPTVARGTVAALDDQLAMRIRGGHP